MPLSGDDLGDAIKAAADAYAAGLAGDLSVANLDATRTAAARALGGAVVGHLTSPDNLVSADTPGLVPAIGASPGGYVLTADGWAAPVATLADGTYADIVVSGSGASLAIKNTVATTAGRAIMAAADSAAQRLALELGTAATAASSAYATAGHDHAGVYQPVDSDLTAIAGLSSNGLVERTGAGAAAIRALGVGASTSIPTRDDADARYAASSHAHAESDVTGLASDLSTLTSAVAGKASTSHTHAAGDITSGLAAVATSGSAADLGSGTLPAGRMPGLTGDVTTSAGAVATTIAPRAVTVGKFAAASTTARVLGRKTASGGDFEEVTASEVLDFLSTTRGSILSRGVATWAALAVGTAGQVLTSGGAGADPAFADNITLTASSPSAPAATKLAVSTRSVGGRQVLTMTSDDGAIVSVEPSNAQGKVSRWDVSASALTPTGISMPSPSLSGSGIARAVATTNMLTMTRRIGAVSSAPAGNPAGWRLGALQFGFGNSAGAGGFHFVCRFAISDAAAVSNARMFVGMIGIITAMANAEPSTNVNLIGVGCEAGQATLHTYSNDGTGTATMVDLGASFPVNTQNVDLYELAMFVAPQGTTVYYTVARLNTGDLVSGSWSSDLPAATQLLAPVLWRNNGSTALAVGIDIVNLSIRTDT